jgi:hypothetical protein
MLGGAVPRGVLTRQTPHPNYTLSGPRQSGCPSHDERARADDPVPPGVWTQAWSKNPAIDLNRSQVRTSSGENAVVDLSLSDKLISIPAWQAAWDGRQIIQEAADFTPFGC